VTTGRKDDEGKQDLTALLSPLLPVRSMNQIVAVLEHGAKKYGADNWLNVSPTRYRRALLRHVAAALFGEQDDRDTGLPHWAHAACCLLFLLALEHDATP